MEANDRIDVLTCSLDDQGLDESDDALEATILDQLLRCFCLLNDVFVLDEIN